QITLVEVVAADVCLRPRDGLRVQVRRLASAERVLPVGLQEGLKVRSAKRGLVQALAIEVLAESPCGVDVRERAQCSLRLSAEPAIALVLRRSLKRAQQARQEHLVVPGGSGAPAYYDRALDQIRIKGCPVIRLAGTHRETVRGRDAGNPELIRQQ